MNLQETLEGMYAEMVKRGHDVTNGDYVFYISPDLAEKAPASCNNLPVIIAPIMPPSHASLTLKNAEFEALNPQ